MKTALRKTRSPRCLSTQRVSTRRGVARAPQPHRWTTQEYLQMGETGLFEGKRVELVEGVIYEMAPMLNPHWQGIAKTMEALRQIFSPPFFVLAQMPLPLSQSSEPEPDVMVFQTESGEIGELSKDNALQCIHLLVEISDTTLKYDQTTKARLYAEAEIAEYWILNLNARQLEIYRAPQNGRYSETRVLSAQENIAPLSAPEKIITIADLLP